MKETDVSAFAATQLELLDKELQAELAETNDAATQSSPAALQRAGLAVLNLHVASERTGLGGKTVVDLELDPAIGQAELPEHGFRVGDIVGLREQVGGAAKRRDKAEADGKGVDGVVVRAVRTCLSIALDKEDAEAPSGKLWIVKLANDVTYKRMNFTMEQLKKQSPSEHSNFVRVLFGQSSPSPVPKDPQALETQLGETLIWQTERLNDSQMAAIKFALASREIALIHGPPGTGKTHTLIELILQMLKKGLRLLVCGPSNISVDNIVERLAPHKIPMVRLGHPARLLPSVMNHSLDILTKTSDAAALVADVRKEIDQKQASIRKTKSGRERKAIYSDLRELRKEYRERERGCVDQLVAGSKVVLATLHGAGGYQLRQSQFDVVIIDEASQALEAQCWVPLLSAKKAVLAGDHLQLPPTIKSLNIKAPKKPAATIEGADAELVSAAQNEADSTKSGASSEGKTRNVTLETTLFDRLLTLHGSSIKRMLTTQYRMHARIMAYPSKALYESKLVAAESCAVHLLSDLPGVAKNDDIEAPLIFFDTQGGDFPETMAADEDDAANGKKKRKSLLTAESKSNPHEAAIVASHVATLVDAGVPTNCIAVITPYNAQLALLSAALKDKFEGVELGTVDSYQGREKEAVVLSLVRSNEEREVGFLGEKRRLNVAMTRPRRQLCVVGDSETVSKGSKFLKEWMRFLEEEADVRYPDPAAFGGAG